MTTWRFRTKVGRRWWDKRNPRTETRRGLTTSARCVTRATGTITGCWGEKELHVTVIYREVTADAYGLFSRCQALVLSPLHSLTP